jgi:hypothetical protein
MAPMRFRAWIAAAAMATLFAAGGAVAAPTCEDKTGLTIRCGTEGAMPVGWSLPAEQRPLRPGASASQILELICVLGVFFALMALLPDFESACAAEWDREEEGR